MSSYAHTAVTIDCPCIPPDAAVLRARPVTSRAKRVLMRVRKLEDAQ